MNLDEIKLIVEALNGATDSAATLLAWWLAINAGKFLFVWGLVTWLLVRMGRFIGKVLLAAKSKQQA